MFSNSKQKHKNYTELGMHLNILHLRMSSAYRYKNYTELGMHLNILHLRMSSAYRYIKPTTNVVYFHEYKKIHKRIKEKQNNLSHLEQLQIPVVGKS